MIGTSSELDAEELLHLAINASQNSQPEQAIDYLKRSLEQVPDNGKALYMLGSLHAEIGMYDRAIEEIEQAVSLEPEIDTAHFQLGLLYVTSGKVHEARTAWAQLDKLDNDHYLHLFKEGMLALIEDRFDDSINKLQQGIKNNQLNLPLNQDMLKMIKAAEQGIKMQPGQIPAEQLANPNNPPASDGQAVLSAYNNNFDS